MLLIQQRQEGKERFCLFSFPNSFSMVFTQIMSNPKHIILFPQKLEYTCLSTEKSLMVITLQRAQGNVSLSVDLHALQFYSCPLGMDQLNICITYLVTSCISTQGPILRDDLSSSFCFICFPSLFLFKTPRGFGPPLSFFFFPLLYI